MAYRNRSVAFFELRQQSHHHRPFGGTVVTSSSSSGRKDVSKIPLISDNTHEIPLDDFNLQPEWTKLNDIDSKLRLISDKIERLGKIHSRHLSTFDDTGEDEREIEILTREISHEISRTHHLIKNLGAKKNLTAEETKIKKNIQSAKSNKLQSISLEFKKKQRIYLNALQRNASSHMWIEDEPNDPDEPEVFVMNPDQLQVVSNMSLQSETREAEIKQIVKSINDLSSILQDISMLVIKQGTLMDQIEYNLEQTEESLTVANVELKKADDYHRSYRTRLCILLVLIILVITMVFVAIIKAII